MATYRRMLKDQSGNNIIPAGILDAIYPVGSIYMSATLATTAQVNAALGGSWEAWGAGRVPVGVDATQTEFNTVEETGGEKTHTLTTSEMPSHSHYVNTCYGSVAANTTSDKVASIDAYGGWNRNAHGDEPTIASTGGGQSHNNLQPYITCYMYKRIS